MTEKQKHICCPTHCCQIHGCKYSYHDCPVVNGEDHGVTGSCEECGLESEGYYGDESRYTCEIELENHRLKRHIDDLQSGMYVNCVYCGHRYGPKDKTPTSMANVLKDHISKCPQHPMATLVDVFVTLDRELQNLQDKRDTLSPRTIRCRLEEMRERISPHIKTQ